MLPPTIESNKSIWPCAIDDMIVVIDASKIHTVDGIKKQTFADHMNWVYFRYDNFFQSINRNSNWFLTMCFLLLFRMWPMIPMIYVIQAFLRKRLSSLTVKAFIWDAS